MTNTNNDSTNLGNSDSSYEDFGNNDVISYENPNLEKKTLEFKEPEAKEYIDLWNDNQRNDNQPEIKLSLSNPTEKNIFFIIDSYAIALEKIILPGDLEGIINKKNDNNANAKNSYVAASSSSVKIVESKNLILYLKIRTFENVSISTREKNQEENAWIFKNEDPDVILKELAAAIDFYSRSSGNKFISSPLEFLYIGKELGILSKK